MDPFRGTVSPQAPDGTGLLLVHPISPRYRVGMGVTHISETLRRRRQDAGLSQRDLALRSGVPQPNIAAYESGRRAPAAATLERLDGVLNIPTFERLRVARELIIRAAEGRRLSDVRVFGSVARGDAGAGSDVDLLVHPGPEASVFDLAGFMAEVEELLGIRVDVVSDRGHGPVMDRIREAAVAL
ncbi:XRE family transcriptional regulator [Sanguibacter gelidistatuariae]|uniref:XRE family transcriptional regulator n=1 Tax=Sanguibacter gelidistatuariae TaxID=1814289 RepID=UPI001FDF7E2F|nr:XRE family transcriptional regulator [Sanguibacter gelidistatuariae]